MLANLENYTIILASQSPRRKQLLQNLGLSFWIKTKPGISEDFPDDMTPEAVAQYLAEVKAGAFPEYHKEGYLLITADTVVCKNQKILNKPADYDEAYQMLSELSASKHYVITGVTVTTAHTQESFASTTSVVFARLEHSEIDYYITRFQPYDKAGAYGIQEWIGYMGVKSIEGSYFNVMGLPVQELYHVLKQIR